MKTLVWVEHDGKTVKDATLAVVTAASKLGDVHLLVAGSGVDGVAVDQAEGLALGLPVAEGPVLEAEVQLAARGVGRRDAEVGRAGGDRWERQCGAGRDDRQETGR